LALFSKLHLLDYRNSLLGDGLPVSEMVSGLDEQSTALIADLEKGMNTSTVPTWQSETSKPHRRGQMVMIEGSLIVFGVMISYWIDLGFSFLEPSSIAWRFPIGFQIILAIFILIAIPGLPESPRWLILKGRDEDALDVLAALSNLPREDKKIQSEFLAVKDVVFEMEKGGFRECFKFNRNRNFHRTALAYVNQMFQQVRSTCSFSGEPC
jgi:MFS family permease